LFNAPPFLPKTIPVRSKQVRMPSFSAFKATASHFWHNSHDAFDVVINLAGEPIANKRWSDQQKHQIFSSRINTTEFNSAIA
jgi:NAD dependent epimerase/dehydratase family enzyme